MTTINIPTVSVVLPTYNRANQLKISIQSVLCQSYTDFELIIVDDASTDNTQEIVAEFCDERIRYVQCQCNVGGGEARNIGIREARAAIIAFQDSDDEWRCHKLEKCLSILEQEPALDGVFSAFLQIRGKKTRYLPDVNLPPSTESMQSALLWGNFVDTPTVVLRSEILNRVGGFDPDIPRYQDWDLFLRLSEIGRFRIINEALIISNYTPVSISTNKDAHKNALIVINNKHKSIINADIALSALWLYRIGEAQMLTNEASEGRKKLLHAAKLKPSSIRYLAAALFAIPGNSALYQKFKEFFQRNDGSRS